MGYGLDFKNELKSLLVSYPQVDPTAMGFPDNWISEPLWSINFNDRNIDKPVGSEQSSLSTGFRFMSTKLTLTEVNETNS